MSQQFALSRNGVPIRLPDERWQHRIEAHAELTSLHDQVLRTISDAELVLGGTAGELLAVRAIDIGKALVVVYRESDETDGFVITAVMTRRLESLDRKPQLWPPRV